MSLNLDKAFGIHALALGLRSRRAEVLAANLANADTPNFKARDVDFKNLLQRAQGPADTSPTVLRVTHQQHLSGAQPAQPAGAALLYRVPAQLSVDGNTVDTPVEKAEFTRNAMQYMTSLQFLNGRITGLLRAIRGE